MKYRLVNVQQRNEQFPRTFHIPPQDYVYEVGDMVKLIFTDGAHNERMWVEITHMNGNSFEGVLRNDPAFLKDLSYDDEIRFNLWHIAAVE